MQNTRCAAVAAVLLALKSVACQEAAASAPLPPENATWMEGYPDDVMARLEARERRRMLEARGAAKYSVDFVLQRTTLWTPGHSVRVAFCGGDTKLHAAIANAASSWNGQANITLEFGLDQKTGTYRTWTTQDKSYAAEIRVMFSAAGYWSYVGRDSIDRSVAPPGSPSLNLAEFDEALPSNWKNIVLHEFGHALGFSHEHQNPTGGCDQEFQWEDRANGTPGVYTVLGRSPNYWPRSKVDQNLRQLSPYGDYLLSPRDRASVMHYRFPEWMFTRGISSPCCVAENTALSPGDIEGLRAAYPNSADALLSLDAEVMKQLMQIENAMGARAEKSQFVQTARETLLENKR